MERCYQCGDLADYICQDCGSRICRAHMEPRYPGPHHKNFTANYMCPVCWLVKRVVLDDRMLRVWKDGSVHQPDGKQPSIFPVRTTK